MPGEKEEKIKNEKDIDTYLNLIKNDLRSAMNGRWKHIEAPWMLKYAER